MPKHSLILALLASLVLSACGGVQSPVVRFDRQVSYIDVGSAAPQSSAIEFRSEINAKTK